MRTENTGSLKIIETVAESLWCVMVPIWVMIMFMGETKRVKATIVTLMTP